MPFKIREARKECGFTQEELAKRASVSRATIIGLENGSITHKNCRCFGQKSE